MVSSWPTPSSPKLLFKGDAHSLNCSRHRSSNSTAGGEFRGKGREGDDGRERDRREGKRKREKGEGGEREEREVV